MHHKKKALTATTLSTDPPASVSDILAYGQQVSPDRRSIWIPNMMQSGSRDSSGDNECQALTPPPRSAQILVTDFSNRKLKAITLLHRHSALTASEQQLKQVGIKMSDLM